MAVAKSYEDMQQIGEPFEDEGKMYVKVRGKCPRCGGSGHYSYNQIDGTKCYGCMGSGIKLMTVRWYTEAERARQDRAAEKRAEKRAVAQEQRRIKFAARNAFGFGEAGFITLVRGDNDAIKEWREDHPGLIWFNMIFKWYAPSKNELSDLPEGITTIRLNWTDVRDESDEEDLQMKDNDFVTAYVNSLTAVPSKSEYQGTVGEWMTKDVTIKRNLAFENRYGTTHMHIMEDEAENVYVWNSSSKSIEEGKTVTLKMKVKEHKDYNGVHQTVVWYCRLV